MDDLQGGLKDNLLHYSLGYSHAGSSFGYRGNGGPQRPAH